MGNCYVKLISWDIEPEINQVHSEPQTHRDNTQDIHPVTPVTPVTPAPPVTPVTPNLDTNQDDLVIIEKKDFIQS